MCCAILFLCWCILSYLLLDELIIPGHDYIFHVSRIEAVADALKQGVFPVRMYVDSAQFWGAPVGIFYPGFFACFPALLRCLGIPIEICYNLFIASIIFLGLFVSWYGFTRLTKSKQRGLFSAILYISSGYYLTDVYIRNALGEALALSFMPLAVAFLLNVVNKSKIPIRDYVLGIVAISGIIESHVLSSGLLFLFGLLVIVFNIKKVNAVKAKRILLITSVLFLTNASFILPFLYFYNIVPLQVHFVEDFSVSGLSLFFLKRLALYWNFWLFCLIMIFLVAVFSLKNHKNLLYKFYLHYVNYFFAGLFLVFLSSAFFPWDLVPPLKKTFEFMQFPWRFMSLATLFFSVCGGFGACYVIKKLQLSKKRDVLVIALLICVTSFTAFTYFVPVPKWIIYPRRQWERVPFYSDEDYLYKDMSPEILFQQGNHYITKAHITQWEKISTSITFSYQADEDSEIILPLVNYPGYEAKDQYGNLIQLFESHNRMIVIHLPQGNGSIKVYYKGILLFRVADYVSLTSLLVISVWLIRVHMRKKWNYLM